MSPPGPYEEKLEFLRVVPDAAKVWAWSLFGVLLCPLPWFRLYPAYPVVEQRRSDTVFPV